MLISNPFSILSESIPSLFMQLFVILMFVLIIVGTILDMIHKKNVKYFFQNARKAKLQAKKSLTVNEKTSIIAKTVASEILTTSELGLGKRRVAHLLGMYGTILFWISSIIMIFLYSHPQSNTPILYPILWHLGACMTFWEDIGFGSF